jgi:hypothetical protein
MKRTALLVSISFVVVLSLATLNWPRIGGASTYTADKHISDHKQDKLPTTDGSKNPVIIQDTAGGQVILHVPAGGNLQQAIDAAQPGDTITLDPGAIYMGNFILRNKTGNAFVTITTAGADPLEGTRITPQEASLLAKIVAPNDSPAISTEAGAHHYRLTDLELYAAAGVYSFRIVALGSGSATTVAEQASNIELNRLYIHGDPQVGGKRGVELNSAATIIKNCWITDFKSEFQDAQGICGINGPGPFTIVNNYVEGGAENIMFGGGVAQSPDLIPSDIVIRHNHLRKPPEWMSEVKPNGIEPRWWVKNLLEFKNGRRALIEENLLENTWVGFDQSSFAILLTVRTESRAMPWAVVEDLTFQRNVVRNAGSGVQILGRDGNNGGRVSRIKFKDNLFYNIDSQTWGKPAYYTHPRVAGWMGRSLMFQILQGPPGVTIEHNTFIQAQGGAGGTWMLFFDPNSTLGIADRFLFTDNIVSWGVTGSGRAEGSPVLDHYTPNATFLNNALIGRNADLYPARNFFPPTAAAVGFTSSVENDYRLAAGSPYNGAGMDGEDLGADIAGAENALRDMRLVVIDIKPGENLAAINTKSNGKLPVAILSSRIFSAPEMVDTATLTFGATGRERSLAFCNPNGDDVNGDGRLDLVCHFNTGDTGLKTGATQAVLKGRTVKNGLIEGSDDLRIVH